MEPRHIADITACLGCLIAITPDSLTLRNDQGTCTARIPANTSVWRGETFHDTRALRLGDDVAMPCPVGYPGRVLTLIVRWIEPQNPVERLARVRRRRNGPAV